MLSIPAVVRIIYSTVSLGTSPKVNKGYKEKKNGKAVERLYFPSPCSSFVCCGVRVGGRGVVEIWGCVSAFFHVSAKLLFLGSFPHLTGPLPA